MKRGRKKKQTPLDAMCEQLIHENGERVGKKSAEYALEELDQALKALRKWSGTLTTAPGWELLQTAEMAILNASRHVRQTKLKERTLKQAVCVLDQRRKGLRVGKTLKELKGKVDNLVSDVNEPKLFQEVQQALLEEAEGIRNEGAQSRRKFLEEIKKHQENYLKRSQWGKNQEAVFENFKKFMPDPHDRNLRAQVSEMISSYQIWLDRYEFPLGDLFKFLSKAGLWQSKKLDTFLERKRGKEKKQVKDRERWRVGKKGQRAGTTRR
jgi:hypothetical protein